MSVEHVKEASDAIDDAVSGYQKARSYYDGNDQSRFLSDLYNEFLKSDTEFGGTLNFAAIPVNAVANRLQLLSIKGPSDDITDKIQEWLNANKMVLRFNQFILDTLKCGDSYILVWPEDESMEDNVLDMDVDGALLREVPLNHKAKMSFCDPETTRAFYDDGGELIYVARKWKQKDFENLDIIRVNLYYEDVIEKYYWVEKDGMKALAEWYDEGQSEWPMENPFGEIPIFHFGTAFPYGEPEHKSLYGVQDAINKIFQVHISALELLGYPIVYALMDETSAAGTSDFEYAALDNPNDDVTSDVNQLQNSPGSVWALRAKSVGQLMPAESNSFIQSLKVYKETASDVSGLPASLFSSTDGQHPGADAVNASDKILRSRVEDRTIILSEILKYMTCFGMKLAFGIELTPADISVQWRPQKIEVDANVLMRFEFMIKYGVPVEHVLTEMGFTEAELSQWGDSISRQRDLRERAADAGLQNAAKAADSLAGKSKSQPVSKESKKDEQRNSE